MDPITAKEGGGYSDLCGSFPNTTIRGGKYIYVMYVCDFNAILTTEMKNISDKYMIRAFIELTEDLKSQGIHPGFHSIDNDAHTA